MSFEGAYNAYLDQLSKATEVLKMFQKQQAKFTQKRGEDDPIVQHKQAQLDQLISFFDTSEELAGLFSQFLLTEYLRGRKEERAMLLQEYQDLKELRREYRQFKIEQGMGSEFSYSNPRQERARHELDQILSGRIPV